MSYFAPSHPSSASCKHCYRLRQDHYHGGRCPDSSRYALYGKDNPMVQWLQENAPKEAAEKAGTVIDGDAG